MDPDRKDVLIFFDNASFLKMNSNIKSKSNRTIIPFTSTRLLVILLIFICSSLFSIYEITFKNQALFTYNTNDVNVTANLRSKDTNGQIEDTDAHLNSQSIHEQLTKGTSDDINAATVINWRKPSSPIRSWSCNLNKMATNFCSHW